MRRRITDEVDIPVHTRAVTIGHELKGAGMDETSADTIGDGFQQVAVAVTGLSRVFVDGFESLQRRIDDVKDELNARIDNVRDELIKRMDKMDEHNRQEHRANRVFMLGILALFTTVFLAVSGGMFTVLNSKIDANTVLIRENSAKIDAVDAKVERILGILEGRDTQ